MKKIIYLLVIVLTLTACKGGKVPQAPMDDEDTVVVEEISEVESEDGYINLGTVQCIYEERDGAGHDEIEDAVLFAKELNNNTMYYYVCPKKGGKKYQVRKCDPSECWGYNGTFNDKDYIYYVYIQSWDDINTRNNNIQSNGDGNTQTVVVEHKRELQKVQKWQNCGGCGGSGSCGTCKGSGQNPFKMDGYEECPQCHGMRKCQFCGGRGGYYYEVLE